MNDEERQAAEAFIRERRGPQDRAQRGRRLLDDFIGKANERAGERGNPLAESRRWR